MVGVHIQKKRYRKRINTLVTLHRQACYRRTMVIIFLNIQSYNFFLNSIILLNKKNPVIITAPMISSGRNIG